MMHIKKLVGLQPKRISAHISDYILPFQPASYTSSRGRLARLIEQGVIKRLPFEWADTIARLLVKKHQTETKEDAEEAEAAAQQFLINIEPYTPYKL